MYRSFQKSAIIAGFVLLTSVSGCGLFCSDKTHEVYVPKIKPCLTQPPPPKRTLTEDDIVQGGTCPPNYAVCLTNTGAYVVQVTIRELRQWAEDAYNMCSQQPPASQPSK